jgi:multidrug efflux pump subunit AcrA (membrane-fusion protein)
VDIKPGELATALKEIIILQDVGSLHAEADVSEANIAQLKIDQTVDITFDALGPDRHFSGQVLTINPGATVVSGVVNYKVKASLNNVPDIKPGMTANMTILVGQKDNVLAVPMRGIITRENKKFVRVIDDAKKKTYHEVEVQIGLEADGGLVEIVSGLGEGQEVVTFIKQ